MKTLLTGAGGFLGWEIVRQMKLSGDYEITAATSNVQKLEADSNYKDVPVISNDRMWQDQELFTRTDVIVHAAFCRKSDGTQLMDSLLFSKKLFERAAACGTGGILNISSQSIYGSEKDDLPADKGSYAPGYLYALAKSASELLLEACAGHTKTGYTNIRLASLTGQGKCVPENVIYKLMKQALSGKELHIYGGQQNFSFLDVKDAAQAMLLLLKMRPDRWEHVYNLGPEKQTNLLELAKRVCNYAQSAGKRAGYTVHPQETVLNTGMDSRHLYHTLGWKPQVQLDDMIKTAADAVILQKE